MANVCPKPSTLCSFSQAICFFIRSSNLPVILHYLPFVADAYTYLLAELKQVGNGLRNRHRHAVSRFSESSNKRGLHFFWLSLCNPYFLSKYVAYASCIRLLVLAGVLVPFIVLPQIILQPSYLYVLRLSYSVAVHLSFSCFFDFKFW